MEAEMTELVLPGHTNHIGTCFGGTIMGWIDLVAAIAAQRGFGTVVTASVDSIQFKKPIVLGDVVTLRAGVNRIWNCSLEVGVKVTCESLVEKAARGIDVPRHTILSNERQVCRAYLTFVAIDGDGKKRNIRNIPFEPGNEMWIRRFEEAGKRREVRLANRRKR